MKSSKKISELAYFNEHLIESNILKSCIKGSKYKGELDDSLKIIFPYKKIGNKYVVIKENELNQ